MNEDRGFFESFHLLRGEHNDSRNYSRGGDSIFRLNVWPMRCAVGQQFLGSGACRKNDLVCHDALPILGFYTSAISISIENQSCNITLNVLNPI
jgi:hypothetical protein